MTLLEFVCEKLMGPPAKLGGSEGESYWRCPFHDDSNPSFHTLPVKSGKKDSWKCFGCGLWGDEYNLLRNFRDMFGLPEAMGNHAHHQVMIQRWRKEFDSSALNVNGRGKGATPVHSLTSVEPLSSKRQPNHDRRSVEMAWANLTGAEHQAVMIAFTAAQREAVSFEALADYCFSTVELFEKMDQEHLAECGDAECDARVCRSARGLPPLTKEEIEAGKREQAEAKRQQMERARERIKGHVNRKGRPEGRK